MRLFALLFQRDGFVEHGNRSDLKACIQSDASQALWYTLIPRKRSYGSVSKALDPHEFANPRIDIGNGLYYAVCSLTAAPAVPSAEDIRNMVLTAKEHATGTRK